MNIFKAAPFFFLRATTASKEDLDLLLSQKDWVNAVLDRFENDPHLREAILIASPALYQALKDKPLSNPEAVATSLFRYLVRMSTRPTPFGHFSFVMNGRWGEKTEVSVDVDHLQKRIRPDMEWLYLFVHKLYQDKNLFASLPIQANPLAFFSGDRCILHYIRRLEDSEETPPKTVAVRTSPLIQAIFRCTKNAISIEKLWEQLSIEMPFLVREKTEAFFYALLEQQLLIPSLLPSLLNASPFKELCSQLPDTAVLHEITQKMHDYEKIGIGKGESLLLDLSNKMQSLAPSKYTLQVDTCYSQQTQQIGKIVADELETTLDFLWKLSPALNPPSPLEGYLEKFMEAYGTYRIVPLTELFSENQGIGPFYKPESAKKEKLANLWDLWLFREWQKALHSEKEEIVLTSQNIDNLLDEIKRVLPQPCNAIPSLDLFCKVCAESAEALDRGEFEILYSESNWQGGASAGRFLDLLGEEAQKNFYEYFQAEEALEPHSQLAELSYWPFRVRLANVAIQPCLRPYRLDLEERQKTPSSLSLEDIYVGITENRFYLTLKEGGKELIFRTGNFLNPDFSPPALKFCRDVSLFRSHRVSSFSWGQLDTQAIFLPRIRFRKTILWPAQWNLLLSDLQNIKASELTLQFQEWAHQWKLPRYFFVLQQGQKLLFDRDHPPSVKEILRILLKEKSLRLTEERESLWMKSPRGTHVSELVVSFIKNAPAKCPIVPRAYSPISFDTRWKLPGSEWIYVNFYLNEEGIQDFLLDLLPKLVDHLSKISDALGWFFIRYSSPKKHIRFRFHFASTTSLSSILILLEQAAGYWMEEGRIHKHEISNYQREVERYGGLNSIDAAEEFFYADSLSVLFLLRSPIFKMPDISLYALTVLCFLKGFGLNPTEIVSCLESGQNNSLLEGYREHKKRMLFLIEALETQAENTEISLLKEASHLRSKQADCFGSIIQSHEQKLEIFRSLLHMHCNRLGLDSTNEQRTLLYAKHGLQQHLMKTSKIRLQV